MNAHASDVLEEVLLERERQDAKWGEQNHLDLSPETPRWVAVAGVKHERAPDRAAEDMGIPTANTARERVENLARRKTLGYADIALEEFCEAVEQAALGDEVKLRTELIQTAAVLVAWVECIDRRRRLSLHNRLGGNGTS
jgi:hypothetical protein